MPAFKPKANKKIVTNSKNNITVDSAHNNKMKEFRIIDKQVIPDLKKEKR